MWGLEWLCFLLQGTNNRTGPVYWLLIYHWVCGQNILSLSPSPTLFFGLCWNFNYTFFYNKNCEKKMANVLNFAEYSTRNNYGFRKTELQTCSAQLAYIVVPLVGNLRTKHHYHDNHCHICTIVKCSIYIFIYREDCVKTRGKAPNVKPWAPNYVQVT